VKYKLLTLAFSMLAYLLQAQTIKTYSGPYGKGNATYQYYEDKNGERIYEGAFKFNYQNGSIIISGHYKNNKPNGIWTWTLKDYYSLFFNWNGIITGEYLKGYKNGKWYSNLSYYISKGGTRVKISNIKNIQFSQNVMVGEYSEMSTVKATAAYINNSDEKNSIEGFLDDSGYKNGEWKFEKVSNNVPVEEIRKYKKGYCYSFISRDESTGKIIDKYDSTEIANLFFKGADLKTGYFKNDKNEYWSLTDPSTENSLNPFGDFIGMMEWPGTIAEEGNNSGDRHLTRNNINSIKNKIESQNNDEVKITLSSVNSDSDLAPPSRKDSNMQNLNVGNKENSNLVNKDKDNDTTYAKVDVEAEFPGDTTAWLRYLNKNLRYPDDAVNNEIQGTVLVQFIVDKEGNVSDVQAISGPNKGGLREEAVRVIKKSGKWIPAIYNGIRVRSYKKRPFTFKL